VTTFPRTFTPRTSTWPAGPGVLESRGLSGKTQLRDTGAIGHAWSETYGPLLVNAHTVGDLAKAQAVAGWLAWLEQARARAVIFYLAHPQRRVLFGAGGGTPLVKGANQTGSALLIDGCPNGATIYEAGDILTIAGLNPVFANVADATVDGSGNATLAIEPPIPAGSSPADDAAITDNRTPGSVLFRARLVDIQKPDIVTAEYLVGLTLSFEEMP